MDDLDRYLSSLARDRSLDAAGFQYLLRNLMEDPISESVFCVAPGTAMQALKERLEFFRRTVYCCPECEVRASGLAVNAKIRQRELWRYYAPLCLLFVHFMENCQRPRSVFGIAGPGGSGKTVVAGLLARLISDYLGPPARAAVLSMDAYHLPNAELDTVMVETPGQPSRPLRSEKGSPRTYDVPAFIRALERVRSEEQVALPEYDRTVHDPVPNRLRLDRDCRIVFVEGNYLLLDRGPWYAVAPLLDVKAFVTLPLQTIRASMTLRHVRGGRAAADAKKHFETVDLPAYRTIMETERLADLIIKRDARQRVVDIYWNDSGRGREDARAVAPEEPELINEGEMQ